MRQRIIKFIVILICIFGLAKSGQATFLPLTVQELDGSPSISKVKNITFNGATLSDLLNGGVMVTVSSTTTSAGSTGALQFNNNNALAADSSNLFWDDTNNRLGIGTNNPGYPLSVVSNTTGNLLYATDTVNNPYFSAFSDSSGRISMIAYGNHGGGLGGAYFSADGLQETWFNLNTRSNTVGQKYMRFGNLSNRFRIQRLNDAGTAIVSSPFTLENAAPTNSFYLNADGNLGIGTNTPTRKLHISEAMRIQPQSSPPSSPALGDLYVDSDTNSLCFYNGSAWIALTGGGCS